MLWLVIVSLALLGLGFGTLVVTFHVVAQATMCVIFIHTLHTVRHILMFFERAYDFMDFTTILRMHFAHRF